MLCTQTQREAEAKEAQLRAEQQLAAQALEAKYQAELVAAREAAVHGRTQATAATTAQLTAQHEARTGALVAKHAAQKQALQAAALEVANSAAAAEEAAGTQSAALREEVAQARVEIERIQRARAQGAAESASLITRTEKSLLVLQHEHAAATENSERLASELAAEKTTRCVAWEDLPWETACHGRPPTCRHRLKPPLTHALTPHSTAVVHRVHTRPS